MSAEKSCEVSTRQSAIEGMGCMTSFHDRRVFLVCPGDQRIVGVHGNSCSAEQCSDGPTFLVIGNQATVDQLECAALRYDIPLDDLLAFRSEQIVGATTTD